MQSSMLLLPSEQQFHALRNTSATLQGLALRMGWLQEQA
jgi:hypothetical protein